MTFPIVLKRFRILPREDDDSFSLNWRAQSRRSIAGWILQPVERPIIIFKPISVEAGRAHQLYQVLRVPAWLSEILRMKLHDQFEIGPAGAQERLNPRQHDAFGSFNVDLDQPRRSEFLRLKNLFQRRGLNCAVGGKASSLKDARLAEVVIGAAK